MSWMVNRSHCLPSTQAIHVETVEWREKSKRVKKLCTSLSVEVQEGYVGTAEVSIIHI